MSWDDYANLVANTRYRVWSWASLKWMFMTSHLGHYQPLTWLSFALDYSIWGLDPRGFHLTNILIHAANAMMFYFLALILFLRDRRPQTPSLPAPRLSAACGALLAAAFFALHPLRVESVAWATERRDVLSGFFFLAALLAHARARVGGRAKAWLALSSVFYLFCILSKTAALLFPAVVVLLDIIFFDRRPQWKEMLPFACIAALGGASGIWAQRASTALVGLDQAGFQARIAQAFYGLAFYLRKTAWPSGLSPLYEKSFLLSPSPFYLSAVFVLTLGAALMRLRKRWPWGFAAGIYYVLMLLPMLGLVKSGRQTVADRYSYLSCLGWALLPGAGLKTLLEARAPGILRGAGLAGGIAILITLAGLTRRQTEVWRNSTSLWSRAVELDPGSYFARRNLAQALALEGRQGEALAELERAKESQVRVYREASRLYLKKGDAERARAFLDRADRL
ncbi:MAG: hypothetical protein HY921_00930 [Elusimicrobia bacterium]|nr:hypothetical protein [Elusimicrobiota bacterium]